MFQTGSVFLFQFVQLGLTEQEYEQDLNATFPHVSHVWYEGGLWNRIPEEREFRNVFGDSEWMPVFPRSLVRIKVSRSWQWR